MHTELHGNYSPNFETLIIEGTLAARVATHLLVTSDHPELVDAINPRVHELDISWLEFITSTTIPEDYDDGVEYTIQGHDPARMAIYALARKTSRELTRPIEPGRPLLGRKQFIARKLTGLFLHDFIAYLEPLPVQTSPYSVDALLPDDLGILRIPRPQAAKLAAPKNSMDFVCRTKGWDPYNLTPEQAIEMRVRGRWVESDRRQLLDLPEGPFSTLIAGNGHHKNGSRFEHRTSAQLKEIRARELFSALYCARQGWTLNRLEAWQREEVQAQLGWQNPNTEEV